MKKWILFFGLLMAAFCQAQSYSINWFTVSGGGGTSAGTNSGAVYAVSGSIGQPAASGVMTGGGYSLTGGFWSLISVVQTPGGPLLAILHAGNSVMVSWPNTGSFTLQQNNNLAISAGWSTSGYSISTNNGTNSITITPTAGNLFFRLAHP